jgi:hypothetical protein
MRNILLLLALSLSSGFPPWVGDSYAQLRLLPQNGKRGVTGDALPLPMVAIGRETLRLAPGGLIFDGHNRTIVHASLPVGAEVWYQLNTVGEIQRIYILTPYEQSRLDRKK